MSDPLREMVEREMRQAAFVINDNERKDKVWVLYPVDAVDVAVRLVRQAKINAADIIIASMCPEERQCDCCDRMDGIAVELAAPPSAGEGEEAT